MKNNQRKNIKKGINQVYLFEKNKSIINAYSFNMKIYYKLILDDLKIDSYEELIDKIKVNKDFKKQVQEATKKYFNSDNIKVLANKNYTKWYFLELKDISSIKYNFKKMVYLLKRRISNKLLNNNYSLNKAVN
ncbi:MAG: hypothetical protein IJ572_00360 [Bacilli bacterium]|nr:hypothetical protein [Bacilli bacterium]